jgi:hypothetical protein
MNQLTSAVGAFIIVVAGGLFVSFLLAWPVMELWNQCLVPAVDGVKEIGWLQAWGLQFLVNLLFKMSIVNKQD